jgi:hypothetical protein
MENKQIKVKALEQLALTALYEEIVSQLLPTMDSHLVAVVDSQLKCGDCGVKQTGLFVLPGHVAGPDVVYRLANYEDYAANRILQSKVVDAIRAKLCHPPYRRVRSSLIEEYCKRQKSSSHLKVGVSKLPDIHLFLDWYVEVIHSINLSAVHTYY